MRLSVGWSCAPTTIAHRPSVHPRLRRQSWLYPAQLQGQRFQIILPTVYGAASLELTPRLMTEAALLAAPDHCVASHQSALLL
ncbi:MAG: hypothetical protein JWP31_61 [Aeromicrobium sp.]|nr:hypothetical protein [Aeromicrobium sp.]